MNRMLVTRLLLVAVATLAQPTLAAIGQEGAAKIKVLVIDGQNNHQWQQTTPVIRQTLLETGLFDVTVATTPAKGQDMSGFAPNFSDYALVVSNYNGEDWSESTRKAFEAFVAGGGGFVAVHAADNSFPSWAEYNRMIGLGGWGGRSEKDGPYVRWKEDLRRFTRDKSPGSGGTHGKRVPFLTIVRDPDHPITPIVIAVNFCTIASVAAARPTVMRRTGRLGCDGPKATSSPAMRCRAPPACHRSTRRRRPPLASLCRSRPTRPHVAASPETRPPSSPRRHDPSSCERLALGHRRSSSGSARARPSHS